MINHYLKEVNKDRINKYTFDILLKLYIYVLNIDKLQRDLELLDFIIYQTKPKNDYDLYKDYNTSTENEMTKVRKIKK